MPEWTDELKKDLVEAYKAAEPTPETSIEIVKGLAEEFDATANGVRNILTREQVYVKASPSKPATSGGGGSTRVNKAEAQGQLKELIESVGKEVDDSIVDKLTGKAALYLVDVFKQND
jgi:hypothetical protein